MTPARHCSRTGSTRCEPLAVTDREFSFARLAVVSLGSATVVLVVTTVIVAVVRPGAGVGLGIVAVGIAGAITVMGVVSTRMTRRGLGDERNDGGAGP